MQIISETLAAATESSELTVTPGALLLVNADNPCAILAKNSASGGSATWATAHSFTHTGNTAAMVATSDRIKVRSGAATVRIEIFEK